MNLWNFFLRRFRREHPSSPATARGRRGRRVAERFRPSVQTLEDRTVPTADMLADATPLSGTFLTATGSNVGATAEPGEYAPTVGAEPINSVWWKWTAATDGVVEVNTLGSNFDTVLAVWTGATIDTLALEGADDDFYYPQSRVAFNAVAGTTYRISVDGYADATGDIVLNLATTPANDDFADATPVTPGGTYSGNNTGSTAEAGEPSTAGSSAPVNSVWWKWTATASGLVEINTFGSELDTLLAVYDGSGLDTLQLVVANDDASGFQSQVFFEAQAGTTYYIAVDGTLQYTGGIVLNLPEGASGSNRPPVVANGLTFTLAENTPGGTTVGTVTASDPDPNQSLTYDIIAGNTSGAFSINRLTGEIRVDNSAALDREVNPTFTLLVSVTDNGTTRLTDSAVVTVNLVDRADAPVFQEYGPFTVGENGAAGTPVGTVLAADSDPGQTVRYAITGGNTNGAFAIDAATGRITVATPSALDHETTPVFRLTVTATDDGTPALSSSAVVIVFVDDGNDAPVIADQRFSIDENSAAGTTAAAVSASDPDGGQTLTYSIIDGDPAGAFEIDPATGRITVRDSSQLNFEATQTFVLTVRVADDGSPALSSTAAITIDLNDVNEPPTFVSAGPFAVDENVPAGTLVGTVTATDQDAATTLTYAITGGNNSGAFAIDAASGEITVANPDALDFELRPAFTLTVRATDNGSPARGVSAFVVITLNDVNDAPVLDNTGSMSLAAVNQGDFANGGTLVSALLASTGTNRVSDQDAGAKQGIAVVAADTTNGSWQYSTDGGSTWLALGSVSDGSARLLAADSLTRVRFVPAPLYNGTVAGGITFRAWDQTAGENGGLADTSVNGGTSAFSTAVETASVKVRSALEQIALLTTDVRTLMNTGLISASDGNQLLSKLSGAKKQLEQGNAIPAENQMTLFTNLVSGLVLSGGLDPALGDDLIAKAGAVIVSIWN